MIEKKELINVIPNLSHPNKERTSIQFRTRYRGQRYLFSPNISIFTNQWIDSTRLLKTGKKYPDNIEINEQIKEWQRIIKEVLLSFGIVTPTQKTFRESVNNYVEKMNIEKGGILEKSENTDLILFAEKFKRDSNRKSGTKETYERAISLLLKYSKEKKKTLYFNDINEDFYNSFHGWMIEKNYSKNYIGMVFKIICTFMNASFKHHGTDDYKKFKREKEDAETIALSKEEIERIYNVIFTPENVKKNVPGIKHPEKYCRTLETERDRFIIGYCTALRHSDYNRIDLSKAKDNILSIWTKKTDKKVYIPVHWMLREIINKYGTAQLTSVSYSCHNNKLKEICKIAGIDEKVTTSKTIGGKRVEITKYKYELVSSHTARRSGATNMYREGIPLEYIQMILGHSKIEQTLKYIKIDAEEHAKRLLNHSYFTGKK